MTLTYSVHRDKRLQDILLILSSFASNVHGKTMRELFSLLSENYDSGSEKSIARSIQYDLRYLQESGEIIGQKITGKGNEFYYRKAQFITQPIYDVNLSDLYQEFIIRGISADLASDFIKRVQTPSSRARA